MSDSQMERTGGGWGSFYAVLLLTVCASLFALLAQIGYATFVRFPARITATHYAMYGACWSVVLLPLIVRRFAVSKLIFYLSFVCVLVALHLVPLNSREVFLRHLRQVQPGMTIEDVQSIMSDHMCAPGFSPWPSQVDADSRQSLAASSVPTPAEEPASSIVGENHVVYYLECRHAESGDFSGDQGIVLFENGRASGVRFLPD